MRINNNIMALNAHRQLGANNAAGAKSMEKLSSGFRINRAADDAAGLAISEKMRGQIRGLKQATRNAQDGISLIQTAEGNLNETHAILQRMRELADQSANDTNNASDRGEIQKEIDQLAQEITRIATDTQFNTKNLLDGSLAVKFHIGANEGQNISLAIGAMDADTLLVSETLTISDTNLLDAKGATVYSWFEAGAEIIAEETDPETKPAVLAGEAGYYAVDTAARTATLRVVQEAAFTGTDPVVLGINVSSQEAADSAITTINNAIETVSAERSKLGAYQNRLEHTIANLGTSAENLQAAESRIRDLDMAEEMMAFTKNSILQQAATAMLAQANMAPQSVLQLLG